MKAIRDSQSKSQTWQILILGSRLMQTTKAAPVVDDDDVVDWYFCIVRGTAQEYCNKIHFTIYSPSPNLY